MLPTFPKSPALVTINSAESQESPENPEATRPTFDRSDSKKNSTDIELLKGLCQNLWTLINERDWNSLRTTPSSESSPSSSPPDLSRQVSNDSVAPSERTETISIRDSDSLATWIAPRFTVELNNREIASSFKDYMRLQRWVAEQHPQYHVTVQEVSTELDMRHGWANVLVFTSVTGYPLGVDRQAVTMFKWKRSERQWWCTKMSTLRGGVESWTVQPSVYLSIFTGIGNKALAFAAAEGAIITWWVRAIQGTTLRKLHYDWEASTNIVSGLFSKHFSILTATSMCAMVILVDGILLQSATTTVQRSLEMPLKLHAMLAPQVPTNFTGLAAKLDVQNDFLSTAINANFAPVWEDWVAQAPIPSPFKGCPGTCVATVRAPAFSFKGCDVTSTGFVDFAAIAAANGDEDAYPAVCELLTDSTGHWCPILSLSTTVSAAAGERESIFVDIGIISPEVRNTGAGNFTQRRCTLEPAIGEYQVTLHGNSTVETNALNPTILSLANNTARAESGPLEYINSTLGGIATLADMRYHSDVLIKIWSNATWLNSPGPFEQSLIENPEFFYSNIGDENPRIINAPVLRDPWDEVLAGLNELMFRAGVLAARDVDEKILAELIDPGLASRYELDGTRVDAQPVFHTRWGYFWGASAMQVVCVALVTITYWKYWTLGRNTSLSPLELAKAFHAPLLKEAAPNSSARCLAEEMGDRKVRYGLVPVVGPGGEDEMSDGRLVFDDAGRVRPLRDGCSTL
ncbi:hypothetical protein M409DRAFT_21256 [Zasmidium cellare ATCC 36951]|uniref:Uncharacterized protein n=1 Tax=Zasmidium cellare ATCC 36951 TaxID=1080233 RepID=A0A6A6CMM6_ZASCE|nr:uncharacterized protein M409DRAFT_21256 [Zasmidium cellare ATCC 36951]KAF2168507.1 hypothetical protein M409DRAFT_21256 [Zasmidium cellare ATCC 36951]